MAKRVSGSLLRVLKVSPVAWYRGTDGTVAYYEHPTSNAQGMVAVNGKRITGLVLDPEGHYWDKPSPRVQQMILEHGVSLERGWTCREEVSGMEINEAVAQSRYRAVCHESGRVSIQCLDEQRCAIFIDGKRQWTVKIVHTHEIIEEMGLLMWCGWHPLQQDLLGLYQGEGWGRRGA